MTGLRVCIFRTALGWAGTAVSERGVASIVLPRADRKAAERGLCRAVRDARRTRMAGAAGRSRAVSGGRQAPEQMLKRTVKALQDYFAGKRPAFALPLDMWYYTAFQKAVWNAAAGVPYGETRSYGWIARRIRRPRAARAVGQALGANPLPIIVPCHRIISSAGTLGGFSSGTALKKQLLDLERR